MIREIDRLTLKSQPLPVLVRNGDKEDRGAVLVVGGTSEVIGAAILAGLGALRVGAGKLKISADVQSPLALAVSVPEARILPGACNARTVVEAAGRAQAIVLGTGLDGTPRSRRAARLMMASAPLTPFVVDAGALPRMPEAARFARWAAGRVVLTPHAGEMAAMLGYSKTDVQGDPLAAAREAASAFQSTVVMKGATTFVVAPDGTSWRHSDGGPGLATSGSGDVLAGAIAGLLARGAAPVTAALWGVWLHAQAGRSLSIAGVSVGYLARDLLEGLSMVLGAMDGKPD